MDQDSDGSPATDGKADLLPADSKVTDSATGLVVAAIQYSQEENALVNGCKGTADGTCGIRHFIKEAAQKGAKLVVTPSYSVYLPGAKTGSEVMPAVGDEPLSDARWPAGSVIRTMTQAAVDEKITLVFVVITQTITEPSTTNNFKAVLAIDPNGAVIARHDCFHLFFAIEKTLTEGTSVATSFFDTQVGKVGLLTDADVQYIATGMMVGADCTQHARDMIFQFFGERPAVVLFPAKWIGNEPENWQALNVMKKVATDSKVWLVVANQRDEPWGNGGGIWGPDGEPLEAVQSDKPTVVYGTIPYK